MLDIFQLYDQNNIVPAIFRHYMDFDICDQICLSNALKIYKLILFFTFFWLAYEGLYFHDFVHKAIRNFQGLQKCFVNLICNLHTKTFYMNLQLNHSNNIVTMNRQMNKSYDKLDRRVEDKNLIEICRKKFRRVNLLDKSFGTVSQYC